MSPQSNKFIFMRTIFQITRPLILTLLVFTSFKPSTFAQDVSIPDSGLNAAVREALQKPAGSAS